MQELYTFDRAFSAELSGLNQQCFLCVPPLYHDVLPLSMMILSLNLAETHIITWRLKVDSEDQCG